MSHTVTIKTAIKDVECIKRACERIKAKFKGVGRARLYGSEANGIIVQLPGWRYEIAIDIKTGTVKMDNYGGTWGNMNEFDKFSQAYAVEHTKAQGEQRNYSVREELLETGEIKITMQGSAPGEAGGQAMFGSYGVADSVI